MPLSACLQSYCVSLYIASHNWASGSYVGDIRPTVRLRPVRDFALVHLRPYKQRHLIDKKVIPTCIPGELAVLASSTLLSIHSLHGVGPKTVWPLTRLTKPVRFWFTPLRNLITRAEIVYTLPSFIIWKSNPYIVSDEYFAVWIFRSSIRKTYQQAPDVRKKYSIIIKCVSSRHW